MPRTGKMVTSWMFAFYPIFWTLVFILFLLLVHAEVGHWPAHGQPRGNAFTRGLDTLLFLGFLVSPLVALSVVVLGIGRWVRRRKFPLQTIVALAIFGVWFWLMTGDHVQAVNWYFDCW